jgi:hypothetical protein
MKFTMEQRFKDDAYISKSYLTTSSDDDDVMND